MIPRVGGGGGIMIYAFPKITGLISGLAWRTDLCLSNIKIFAPLFSDLEFFLNALFILWRISWTVFTSPLLSPPLLMPVILVCRQSQFSQKSKVKNLHCLGIELYIRETVSPFQKQGTV